MVGNFARSLNSRTMAMELRRRYPEYHPRARDISTSAHGNSKPQSTYKKAADPQSRIQPSAIPGTQPPAANYHSMPTQSVPIPTSFVPLPPLNQSYPPLVTYIPLVHQPPVAPMRHPWPNSMAVQQQYPPNVNQSQLMYQPSSSYVGGQYPPGHSRATLRINQLHCITSNRH